MSYNYDRRIAAEVDPRALDAAITSLLKARDAVAEAIPDLKKYQTALQRDKRIQPSDKKEPLSDLKEVLSNMNSLPHRLEALSETVRQDVVLVVNKAISSGND